MKNIDFTSIKYNDFLNPSSYFRPAPFWSINNVITPEETARQMSDMIDVGLSGGFFHSRSGLVTPYMGSEWFDNVRAAINVAKERDGYVWLYDEDLWPSGAAGGEVTRHTPEHRKALLEAEFLFPGEIYEESEDKEYRYGYRIIRNKINLTNVEQISKEELNDGVGERLVLSRVYQPIHGTWGASYANLLHEGATQNFIDRTHKKYAEEIGDEFGDRVPGIFTDEPNIIHGSNSIAWYDDLPKYYIEKTGRILADDLPWLFFNGGECRRIRLLIARTISDRYVEVFSKKIFDWCAENNLAYTGHYNDEDSLLAMLRNHSGGIMHHYLYQQIPGIDHLFRQTTPMLFTIKQAASVARQTGRQVLSEIFGVMRHSANFSDFRWVGNFDLAMGVTVYCPHLTWYSATGRRKRDWPQNWSYQQTYWSDLKPLNDYFTRLASILSRGVAKVDAIMLHPIESAASFYLFGMKSTMDSFKEDASMVTYYDKKMREIIEGIVLNGYDCDLGDEEVLSQMGAVNGDKLTVGKAEYSVIIVPPGQTWRESTVKLLEQFVAGGGKIIFCGERPTEIDCITEKERWNCILKQSQSVASSPVQLLSAFESTVVMDEVLHTADGLRPENTIMQRRSDGATDIWFVVNNDRNRGQSYRLYFKKGKPANIAIWDAETGKKLHADGGKDFITFQLPPAGGLLITAGMENATDVVNTVAVPEFKNSNEIRLDGEWDYTRSEPNVLVIDNFSYSIDGKNFSADMPFYDVQCELKIKLGLNNFDWVGEQPWVTLQEKRCAGKEFPVTIKYKFCNQMTDKKPVFVVVENLSKAHVPVMVNGKPVVQTGCGWIWDHDFNVVEISEQLKNGENDVCVTLTFDAITEVESAYIIGDFGVQLTTERTGGIIVNQPEKLNCGSWKDQLMPFYTGRISYSKQVEISHAGRHFLRLRNPAGIIYKARVNGCDAVNMFYAPYIAEITPYVKKGSNTIEIEVCASRQNLFGPLHEKEGEANRVCGGFAFTQEWFVREEFSLYDFGLLDGTDLITVE
jgi:hypothetical protein